VRSPSLTSAASTRILALGGALALAGCSPEIGDACTLSTDCSIRGDRLCDTAQPGGYCTQFNCGPGSCPDEAHCVLFDAAIPGCGFDDRAGRTGSRVARSFCVYTCGSNVDCRPGYTCADPRTAPWNARILDGDQSRQGCLVSPLLDDAGVPVETPDASAPPPVCGPVAPDVPPIPTLDAAADAAAPPLDAGADAADAATPDAGADAGADAGDGG
jgi:hypothetical protein